MISEELGYIQGSATTREAVTLFEKTDEGEHKKICNIEHAKSNPIGLSGQDIQRLEGKRLSDVSGLLRTRRYSRYGNGRLFRKQRASRHFAQRLYAGGRDV